MAVKVALNGMGRIGRCILRHYLESNRKDVEIVAVNAPGDIKRHIHLLKYDSIHGVLPVAVNGDEKSFTAGDKKMVRFDERDPAKIDWASTGAEIVLECTGHFKTKDEASAYRSISDVKVMISAPSPDADATIVMGVNDDILKKEHNIISIGSCTTNCLAPVAKVLNDKLGIEKAFVTTVHAYTSDQNLVDGAHNDLRRARAANLAMIPTSTGAAKAIGQVIPELKGKFDGTAIRVPTPNVSMIDFCANVSRETSVDEINKLMREASEGKLKGILGYTEEPLVSIDFNGTTESSYFDATGTYVLGKNFIRIVSWYDNEFAFSVRMLDVAAKWGNL
ncbi:MAG TPA: type I glyceraldehyde-3-phosphate dehydrogenase [Alphaproteobacteria bacterium]|nr:type I glyceraldehyde-3-phosphate dehydrogenase [Alphaproteobacteria bacterium]